LRSTLRHAAIRHRLYAIACVCALYACARARVCALLYAIAQHASIHCGACACAPAPLRFY
jgi:hypothetical protein